MLRTLEAFGFEWDGEVLYQSSRRDAYRAAIAALAARARLLACSCSRKDLGTGARKHRAIREPAAAAPTRPGPVAQRFRVSDRRGEFDDLFQVPQGFDLTTCGDVVIERRDRVASYQLAVVVDDAFQASPAWCAARDLIASTPWQIDLQRRTVTAAAYLRTSAAVAGARRRQTIEVAAVAAGRPRWPAAGQSIRPQYPWGSLQPLRFCPRLLPPNWPAPRSKTCGNGHLRTGTRKRLRAGPDGLLSVPGDR